MKCWDAALYHISFWTILGWKNLKTQFLGEAMGTFLIIKVRDPG